MLIEVCIIHWRLVLSTEGLYYPLKACIIHWRLVLSTEGLYYPLKSEVDNTNSLNKSQYHTKTQFNDCCIIYSKEMLYHWKSIAYQYSRRTSVRTFSFLFQANVQIFRNQTTLITPLLSWSSVQKRTRIVQRISINQKQLGFENIMSVDCIVYHSCLVHLHRKKNFIHVAIPLEAE